MKKVLALLVALLGTSMILYANNASQPTNEAQAAPSKESAANAQANPQVNVEKKAEQMHGSSGDEASPENDKDPEADQ